MEKAMEIASQALKRSKSSRLDVFITREIIARLKKLTLLTHNMKLLAQGAEAKVYSDGKTVVKERFEKKYRHPELDRRLRKFRTRREAKVMGKLLEIGVVAPDLISVDDKEMKVTMKQVPGQMVKIVVDKEAYDAKIFEEIGKQVAKMHDAGVIHQDLTTSNMIMDTSEDDKIYFIDFGLSFFSEKDEDKAVDLHLLKHAIESRHYKIADEAFSQVVKGYKKSPKAEQVLARLKIVEERGRNKHKA